MILTHLLNIRSHSTYSEKLTGIYGVLRNESKAHLFVGGNKYLYIHYNMFTLAAWTAEQLFRAGCSRVTQHAIKACSARIEVFEWEFINKDINKPEGKGEEEARAKK